MEKSLNKYLKTKKGVESFWGHFKKNPVQALVVVAVMLLGCGFYAEKIGIPELLFGSILSPMIMSESPGAVQLQGNGNTVNQISSGYVETGRQLRREGESYLIDVAFLAKAGAILPAVSCLQISADVKIQEVKLINQATRNNGSSSLPANTYSDCLTGLTRDVTVWITFLEKPTTVNATIVPQD